MATKDKDTKTAFEKIQESRQAIVNEVVELLESGKKLDWSMGWSRQNLKPHNPVSGTQYQGGNRLRLAWAAIINEYQDPRWCTFNQAKAQGWQIKKGSKGVLCESFIFEREVKDLDENGNVKRDENGDIVYKTEKLEKPIRTTFTLFNASQIHGIPQLVAPTPQSKQVQLDVAKDFIASSDCPITYAAQERAFYSLGLDRITVPPKDFFKDEESFLATVTHEMGHSTGHKKRLDRDMSGDFGSMSYAKEELVAELCSMFTQSNLDIELKGEHFENHAAYLQSWISILKDDPNELFIAAEKASKAADYLYDRFIEYDNEKLKSAKEFGEPIYAYSGLTEDTPYFVEKMNEAMQERGYKHNIWGGLESFASLGGKIKDGEQPLRILNDDFDSRIYNIEQFEGVDLNLSDKIYHPKFEAYIQEHADELKNIHPNGLPITPLSSLAYDPSDHRFEQLQQVLKEKGYKHNIWVDEYDIKSLGGKIKDGENPLVKSYYNIEQTEGCDLSASFAHIHPQVQAYIKEHPVEINPKLPINAANGALLEYRRSTETQPYIEAMEKHGYKHNIWVEEDRVESLGGKIKDGENPLVKSYYNIDQTEGLDLNKPWLTSSPYIKDYLFNKQLEANLDDHVHIDAETTAPIGVRKDSRFEYMFNVKGYSHKIWLHEAAANRLGGKIKEGEKPKVTFRQKGFDKVSYYNIEQTEGCDLSRSMNPKHPYIRAYIEEQRRHQVESESKAFDVANSSTKAHKHEHEFTVGKNNNSSAISRAAQSYATFVNKTKEAQMEQSKQNTNELARSAAYSHTPTNAKTGQAFPVDYQEQFKNAFESSSFTNNLWVTRIQAKTLGGDIKPNEKPLYVTYAFKKGSNFRVNRTVAYYNLDQTIGCDLSRSDDPSHHQIKAYIQAQSLQQNPSQQQAHESTSKQAPVLASFGNKDLDARVKKITEGFGFTVTDKNEIKAAVETVKSFNIAVVKDIAETKKKHEHDAASKDASNTKEDPERDAVMAYLVEQGIEKAPPRTRARSKEPRNKDPER